MELMAAGDGRVMQDELIGSINASSFFLEANAPQEDRLNFLATFTAENGAELNFEFHCSNSADARDHIEGLANYFRKDINFLRISGAKWNTNPDKLKRVFLKRKLELGCMEFEFANASFFSIVSPQSRIHQN